MFCLVGGSNHFVAGLILKLYITGWPFVHVISVFSILVSDKEHIEFVVNM